MSGRWLGTRKIRSDHDLPCLPRCLAPEAGRWSLARRHGEQALIPGCCNISTSCSLAWAMELANRMNFDGQSEATDRTFEDST
jgi:hypothetical protein